MYCSKTGIITCHGFNFEPFTNNVALAQKMKDYRAEYNKRNEVIAVTTVDDFSLCFKCNENTSKNGSIKIPHHPVYLRRNILKTSKNKLGSKYQFKDLEMSNGIHSHFSNQNLKIRYKAGSEDLIIRKRQKISEEVELETNILNSLKSKVLRKTHDS